mmetsp:Transcript_50007/g.112336  ORF Transcript_50007/g.112336 Transcript_50007/m.112336 type:complete len:215 (-) Transcript_50007:172-816(-)
MCLADCCPKQSLVLLQRVQGALVQGQVKHAILKAHLRGIHVEPFHVWHGVPQALLHVVQQMLADVHVGDGLVASQVHLFRHVGVAAAQHEDLVRRRQVGAQHIADALGRHRFSFSLGCERGLEDPGVPAAVPVKALSLVGLVVVVVPVTRVGVCEGVLHLLHLLVREIRRALKDCAADDAHHRADVSGRAAARLLHLSLNALKLRIQLLCCLAV